MPNHILNELTPLDWANDIKIDAVLDSFKTSFYDSNDKKVDETCFDFNTLIPLPEVLNVRNSDGYSFQLKQLLEKNVSPKQLFDETILNHWVSKGMELPTIDTYRMSEDNVRRYIESYRDYGHIDWYSWSIENWGTKWNAYECKRDEHKITFETAWYTPVPIWKALTEKYPTITWRVRYSDEDTGGSNHGILHLQGGDITEEHLDLDEKHELAAQMRCYESYFHYLREMEEQDY
jgi:hypothetical protein